MISSGYTRTLSACPNYPVYEWITFVQTICTLFTRGGPANRPAGHALVGQQVRHVFFLFCFCVWSTIDAHRLRAIRQKNSYNESSAKSSYRNREALEF